MSPAAAPEAASALPFSPVIARPLPHSVTPFPNETLASYRERLAVANQTKPRLLHTPSRWPYFPLNELELLAVLSSQSEATLVRALPELRRHAPSIVPPPTRLGVTIHYACRRCVARRTGTTKHSVGTWMSRHDQVCIPHRLWIGRAVDSPARQFDLTDLPEIVESQRRHHRLLRRHGHLVMDPCYQHCSNFWHSLFQRGYRLSDRAERLRQMAPVTRFVRPFEPLRYIAVYPEIIEAISLYASPHWRSLALANDEATFEQFKAEFHRRLPQERALRTTARAWFRTELKRTAQRIEQATSNPG